MATAHTTAQPGLQSASWAPADDLMKEFVIEVKRPGQLGWLALKSFDKKIDALKSRHAHIAHGQATAVRIYNNFRNRQEGGVWSAVTS